MAQQFNVQFPTGGGLPQPFQAKKSVSEAIIDAGKLRQAKLNEQRRRLERAQQLDRDDLKSIAGFNIGQLSDSFRPLFQQDVEEVRKFIMTSDDVVAQQNKIAELSNTWQWMNEHNNETVQAARKAHMGVAFSDPQQQKAASANLDVGLEFDEDPSHFAEVEDRFNNFFDPKNAKKIDGVWMVYNPEENSYKDIRELEGYANAEVYSPRTRNYDVGTIGQWATMSETQRVLNLDGKFDEDKARRMFNDEATLNSKLGKEHRAQILATLNARGESPFTRPDQERAFIDGVPPSKDDPQFVEAQAAALKRGEEIFVSEATSRPTQTAAEQKRSTFIDSKEATKFEVDGFNVSGTVRSLTGLKDIIIQDPYGNSLSVTPDNLYIDRNNVPYLEYADMDPQTGSQTSSTVRLEGKTKANIDLQLRNTYGVSISDLFEERQERTGPGSLDDLGLEAAKDANEQALADLAREDEMVEYQDLPSVTGPAVSKAAQSVPETPEDPRSTLRIGDVASRLPKDSPLITIDPTTKKPAARSGVLEKVVESLDMTPYQASEFLSIPSVNSRLKDLGLEQIGVGTDRPMLGSALESVFGVFGYKTAVTKNAEIIMDFLNSDEGMEMQRKYFMMGAPGVSSPNAMDLYPVNQPSPTIEMPTPQRQAPTQQPQPQGGQEIDALGPLRQGIVGARQKSEEVLRALPEDMRDVVGSRVAELKNKYGHDVNIDFMQGAPDVETGADTTLIIFLDPVGGELPEDPVIFE